METTIYTNDDAIELVQVLHDSFNDKNWLNHKWVKEVQHTNNWGLRPFQRDAYVGYIYIDWVDLTILQGRTFSCAKKMKLYPE